MSRSPTARSRCWSTWPAGYSNQEIADESVISERTVRTHVSNILSKLHLANRTQAAALCPQRGSGQPG
ncbi:MAG: LuxR C-terminal-related transcriptional regulator [Tetrasphaera sp.]